MFCAYGKKLVAHLKFITIFYIYVISICLISTRAKRHLVKGGIQQVQETVENKSFSKNNKSTEPLERYRMNVCVLNKVTVVKYLCKKKKCFILKYVFQQTNV